MPLTVAEIVAGQSRQGTAVGKPLLSGVGKKVDDEIRLPIVWWEPFARAVAHCTADGTVAVLEGVFEEDKGRLLGESQLAALGITMREPIGIYRGRYHNRRVDDLHQYETYNVVLYDTAQPDLYVAYQSDASGSLLYGVIRAASREALGMLPAANLPLSAALTFVDSQNHFTAEILLRGMHQGAVVPPSVTDADTKWAAIGAAQQQEWKAAQDKLWAPRLAEWQQADVATRCTMWAQFEPALRSEKAWRDEFVKGFDAQLRAEAGKVPLPRRYLLQQMACYLPEVEGEKLQVALAAAEQFAAAPGEKLEELREQLTLLQPSIVVPEVQQLQAELEAAVEARFAAEGMPLSRRWMYIAQRSLSSWQRPKADYLDALANELKSAEYGDPLERASHWVETKVRWWTSADDAFSKAFWPGYGKALAQELLTAASVLEGQGRWAHACELCVQARALLPAPVVPDVVSWTEVAALPADDQPLHRARRDALHALARFEPPLSLGTTHGDRIADRLGEPPYTQRPVSEVLGIVPEGRDDFRQACQKLGLPIGFVDVRETADGLQIVSVDSESTGLAGLGIGFDAWAQHYFPLPADLLAESKSLKEEQGWLKTEFEAIGRQKVGLDAELKGVNEAQAAGNQNGVDAVNAHVKAWNARNDTYQARQSAYNARVPAFNKRLTTEQWGKILEFRKKLDAAIDAYHERRLKELSEELKKDGLADDAVRLECNAYRWLALVHNYGGGPNLKGTGMYPPRPLIERDLAWLAEDAFHHPEDEQVLDGLESFMVRSLFLGVDVPTRLGRLRPLIDRFIKERDRAVVRDLFEKHWQHFIERDAVLQIVHELTTK